LRNYTELYAYDPVGNFLTMAHQAANGNWTRAYAYNEVSLTEPGKQSNRLSQTALQTGATPPVESYAYDVQGNITRMPHLPTMLWNYRDEMCASSQQVVNAGAAVTTYYVYGVGGQRTRKVTDGQNGARQNERFYLGGFEVYREYDSEGSPSLDQQTLHVMDDKQRIALVETQTVGGGASTTSTQRYQLGNHLGSASLELDPAGALISCEEYSPYGNSTYKAGRSAAEVSLKRYRFTGKERDEENGFTYHGKRYHAPWLGRWTTCDPKGISDDVSLYVYARNNPIIYSDPAGMDAVSDPINRPPPNVPTPDLNQVQPPQQYHWGGKLQDAPPGGTTTGPRQDPLVPKYEGKAVPKFDEAKLAEAFRQGQEHYQAHRPSPVISTDVLTPDQRDALRKGLPSPKELPVDNEPDPSLLPPPVNELEMRGTDLVVGPGRSVQATVLPRNKELIPISGPTEERQHDVDIAVAKEPAVAVQVAAETPTGSGKGNKTDVSVSFQLDAVDASNDRGEIALTPTATYDPSGHSGVMTASLGFKYTLTTIHPSTPERSPGHPSERDVNPPTRLRAYGALSVGPGLTGNVVVGVMVEIDFKKQKK
jgi:RHS repeat-associated protein